MGESPPGRCGYEWPTDCDRVEIDIEYVQYPSCCARESVSEDVDRCIWHAEVNEAGEKPVDELFEASTPEEIRKRNTPVDELLDGVVLSNCKLESLSFSKTALRGADLTHADLTATDLTDARLRNADLTDATLEDVDLTDADLGSAKLTNANLTAADLTDAYLGGTDLTDAHLGGADLTKTYLGEANLTNAYLLASYLTYAKLWDADLTDANLRGAKIINTFLGKVELTDANLQDAKLTEVNLSDANLTDADLTGANLTGNLERANLTRANLFDTDLCGVAFYGAVTTDTQINEGTKFGDHYTDNGEIEKAAWSLSQIEKLSRQNALPDQIREAFTKRKDRRRNHYWHHSKVPGWLDMYICRLKTSVWSFLYNIKCTLKSWTNAADPPVILFINWFRAQIHGTDPEIYSNTSKNKSAGQPAQATRESTDAESETIDAKTDDTGSDDNESDLTNWERYVNTARWGWLALTGVVMRYGESARRVVTLSLLTILAFGMAYPFVGGIEDGGTEYTIQFTSEPSLAGLATAGEVLLRNLYFSTITFTTIGYANVAPVGPWSRVLVGIESFAGALLMALLVFVLGRRSTR